MLFLAPSIFSEQSFSSTPGNVVENVLDRPSSPSFRVPFKLCLFWLYNVIHWRWTVWNRANQPCVLFRLQHCSWLLTRRTFQDSVLEVHGKGLPTWVLWCVAVFVVDDELTATRHNGWRWWWWRCRRSTKMTLGIGCVCVCVLVNFLLMIKMSTMHSGRWPKKNWL